MGVVGGASLMGRKVPFFDFTRRLLRERLQLMEMGQTPTWTDIRHFFYECRNRFLRENPQLNDIEYQGKDPYGDFQRIMRIWCMTKSPKYGIDPDLYWRFREILNIWAEPRATCDGETGSFLVDNDKREKVSQNCSFILVCEKKTVKRELLEALRGKGYKLNLIATGGNSSSDVQEAIISIKESIDSEDVNFYCLVLHDYDLDGVKIFSTLKQRWSSVIDVGVNGKFINYLKTQGKYDPRLVEEKRLNKKYQHQLREEIESGLLSEYTLEDFDYLQGDEPFEVKFNGKTKNTRTHWIGKRIEIDAIHVEYGIQPFIDYILKKIEEECKFWDLSRIGVEEFELEEPPNLYDYEVEAYEKEITKNYKKKLRELKEPLNKILDIIIKSAPNSEESFFKLAKSKFKYVYKTTFGGWEFDNWKSEEIDELLDLYEDERKREWSDAYEDDLQEINDQITHYEGDVREGEMALQNKFDETQEKLEDAVENDPDLSSFSKLLWEVDWGKDDLDKLKLPNEAELIRLAIQALQNRLVELGVPE